MWPTPPHFIGIVRTEMHVHHVYKRVCITTCEFSELYINMYINVSVYIYTYVYVYKCVDICIPANPLSRRCLNRHFVASKLSFCTGETFFYSIASNKQRI